MSFLEYEFLVTCNNRSLSLKAPYSMETNTIVSVPHLELLPENLLAIPVVATTSFPVFA